MDELRLVREAMEEVGQSIRLLEEKSAAGTGLSAFWLSPGWVACSLWIMAMVIVVGLANIRRLKLGWAQVRNLI